MDDLLEHIVQNLSAAMQLQEAALPPELARTRYPLGALELVCRNWQADRFSKIYAMRMRVKIPSLDIIGMAFHPRGAYDLPLFQFDLSAMKKKIIAYINVLAVFPDSAYHAACIEPFAKIRERYSGLHPFKMPEWMQVYRNSATLYVDPDPASLRELQACVREYFSQYLQLALAAERVPEPGRLEAVRRFHAAFRHDLLTKDRSQIMLAKVIGREKAGRIFREVLT